MPMYFPDLESVQRLAKQMAKKGISKPAYTGTYPETIFELPQARKELGKYLREVWGDDVFAVEVERAATPDNYDTIMKEYVMEKFLRVMRGGI